MDCGHHDEWSSLGVGELREEERRALAAHRDSCRRCAAAARLDGAILAAVGRLADPAPVPGPVATPRPRTALTRSRRRALAAAALLGLAVACFYALSSGPADRPGPNGRGTGDLSVQLVVVAHSETAVAETVRPIAGGMEVLGDEALELRFVTTGAGYLSLWEEGVEGLGPVWPEPGEEWLVGPGTHVLAREGSPVLLHRDGPPRARTFVAVLSVRPLGREMAAELAKRPVVRDRRAADRVRVLWTGGP